LKREIDKSIDELSDRLDRLEVENEISPTSDMSISEFGLTEDELEKLSPMEKYILKFNWYVNQTMPYYKAEVMQVDNSTSEEYDRRTLEVDQSIYLQLDYEGLRDKFSKGELAHKIATGGVMGWRDEKPDAVF
jgi:hypothetical protein